MLKSINKITSTCLATAVLALGLAAPKPAAAQEAICMAQVMAFGGNFCPRGWLDTNGQLLSINQYQALFSILGTMYGGDGRTTFGLPDLRNRSITHVGNGPGLGFSGNQGSRAGETQFTLTQSNMPAHTHQVNAAQAAADSQSPNGNLLAGAQTYHSGSGASTVPMSSSMLGTAGSGLTVSKRSPMQVIRYCIATQGIFCSRN